MNWKDIGTEVFLGIKDLFLDLLSWAFSPTIKGHDPWLDSSDSWTSHAPNTSDLGQASEISGSDTE